RGNRIAEEAEAQSVPLTPFAATLHRVERVGAKNRERRNLVKLHGLHSPLELYCKRNGGILSDRFLERTPRARVIGLQQRNARIGRLLAQTPRSVIVAATRLEVTQYLRIRQRLLVVRFNTRDMRSGHHACLPGFRSFVERSQDLSHVRVCERSALSRC